MANNVYSWNSGIFKLRDGNWKYYKPTAQSMCCRHMIFKSSSPDSLIQEFDIRGHTDNIIEVFLFFNKDQKFEEYLKFLNIKDIFVHPLFEFSICHAFKPNEINTLFNFLIKNNTFPKEYIDKIKAIFEKYSFK